MFMLSLLSGVALGPVSADGPFEADWASLAGHSAAPEWLKDAKLGIYFHWGPYTVPAFGDEWYPRWMFFEGRREWEHHEKTYGPPSEFGYHDFVPKFTGEHFDPEEWADLFQRSGARFAGPVAEHHDGFSMWDSDVTPWNAADKGPQRDILGDLFASLRKRDLKTIATFHHARNLQRYRDVPQEETHGFHNSHFPYLPGMPTASEDPELRLLYGNVPEDEWLEKIWFGKLREVVDRYEPDIVWFDSWLDEIPDDYRRRFCAYYLNQADSWDKDVAIVRKQDDLPLDFTINDHEKSREAKALADLWMTDDTISTGSWCYTENLRVKPLDKVVHGLVDAVSKNGVVLLNISPMADGTIPEDQRQVLLGLGAWLSANGDAIYDTRPWLHAAEGPTSEPEGGFARRDDFLRLEYSARDIRYTSSKDGGSVYAVTLGVPVAGDTVLLKSFADVDREVSSVVSLADEAEVSWEATPEGLKLTAPQSDEKSALAFRISLTEQ